MGVSSRLYKGPVHRSPCLLATVLLLGGCSDLCANAEVTRVPSPDGTRDAVVFQRDCGASTGFTTQISILGKGEQPGGAGNVFRADDNHGAAVDGAWFGPWAEVTWTGPDRMQVRYADKSRIYTQESEVSGVTISYQRVAGEEIEAATP
jgi:hypothetical protein